ncbi:MAG: acylneuraminate cytidylyltransferase family protein, partial [Anaerolineales bacterium]
MDAASTRGAERTSGGYRVSARQRVLGVIPARGGSKGVPRKNLVQLAGKPLLAHSIEAARQAELIDRVVVSTEDEEIAAAARGWGAEVVPRPTELATDTAPTDPVLEHAVEYLEELDGYRPGLVVLLQPTSPLRPPGLIDACIERLLETGADSLLTVFQGHTFFWRRPNGELEANYDPEHRPRRQDIPSAERYLLENGSVYVTCLGTLTGQHTRLGGQM